MKKNYSKKGISKVAAIISTLVVAGVGNQSANAITNVVVGSTGDLTPAVNGWAGKFTTGALTTASDAKQAITLTNTTIDAGDYVRASVAAYSGTGGIPVITTVSVSADTAVFSLGNAGGEAFDGDFTILFEVIRSQAA